MDAKRKRFKTVDDMVVEVIYKPEATIKYLRNKVKRLEAIAERAGDVEGIYKVYDWKATGISRWLLTGKVK